MKRSGLRGVSFNRKRCCGSDKARHDRLLVRTARNHQSRRLALPLLLEFSRCRRSHRRTRDHRVVRSDSAVVLDVRARPRTKAEALTRPDGRHLDLDEVFVTIHGRRQYLWRALDQDGNVLNILIQSRRDRRAAFHDWHDDAA